jgi:hypothetical protein
MALDAGNIKIQPMNAIFGEDRAQVSKVTVRADVSSDLNNDYFMLYSPSGRFYVWFNVATTGVDPAIAGYTGIPVAISANANASTVASAVQAAVDAHASFVATSSQAVVTITNAVVGYAPTPREGSGTGFAFEVTTQGSVEADLGFLDGSVEWTVSKSMVDVTGHQRGAEVLAQIMNGTECELTLNLKETTKANLLKALQGQGGTYIPEGADATELTGFGQFKNFSNTLAFSQRLVLHPVNKLPGDKSEDVCFWKAFPMMESISFSGEDLLTIPLTFKSYPDLSKPDTIQHFCVGDWTQLV